MGIELDKAKQVRKGEQLNEKALESYMIKALGVDQGKLIVQQFPSGFSNLTYLIKFANKEYVLRRPPFGANIKSGHDMGREYKILSALEGNYDKAPKPILFCDDLSVLEAPFYLMERVQGTILRASTPQAAMPNPAQFQSLSVSLIDTLVELHKLDYKSVGLEDLGNPTGYIERQVVGWSKRYREAKTHEVKEIEATAKWLNDHMPQSTAASLVHNDFKYDNLVLTPDEHLNVKAVLDWEMTTLGHPLMDFGTTLGYWIHHTDPDFIAQNQLNLTTQKGNPTRGELVEMYAKKSGQNVDDIVFYFVFGVFKIAVIVQQIYFRYTLGHTQDPRFKHLDKIVALYGLVAQQAIQKKKLDHLF